MVCASVRLLIEGNDCSGFFQAEDGIRDVERSRGLGDVYKRQRDDFHVIADYLRRELREHGKLNSDRLWDEIQIKFLNQHTYFTKSAIKLRQAKKEKHIREIEERYARNEYKD